MLRPATLWEQYLGKAVAEAFRGSARWPIQPHPCELEPPFDPFYPRALSLWDCQVNGWEGPWEGSWLRRMASFESPLHRAGEDLLLPELPSVESEDLVPIVVEQFCEDQTTIPKIQQFLLALPTLHRPLSFELIGFGPQPQWDNKKFAEIRRARDRGERRSFREAIMGWEDPYSTVQFVAHKLDASQVQGQLLAHYPNSAIVIGEDLYNAMPGNNIRDDGVCAATLTLSSYYFLPLKIFGKLDPDPLGVAIAAMDQLDKEQWALLQVLFQPTFKPWGETLTEAAVNPYQPKEYLLEEMSERVLREKFATPLFSVSVRILSNNWAVYRQLEGWAEQFSAPPQRIRPNKSCWSGESMSEEEREIFGPSVDARCTHRPGMLLNLHELSSLVHLPSESVVSDRLRRVKTRTRPAPKMVTTDEGIRLGENVHQGRRQQAVLPQKQRLKHCYVAGATGTGKSTLLLNMIVQDIQAGRGVGVLDPHGDLVKAVLQRIPRHRVQDVILFDPADEGFPFKLNILEAKDVREQERILNETIAAMQRQFASSWGQRLQRILTYTIQTVLHAIPGGTLGDVERMLTDSAFREATAARIKDLRLETFWREQFRTLLGAIDPVLNKLSVFLASPVVRNIICQPRSAIDFDDLINHKKILLANLSTGLLSGEVSGIFGSFLVTKITNAAFRRAAIPEDERIPWYLYVDEFQAFMDLSIGFEKILSETRKYRLVLAGLANQYVGQLSPPVKHAIFGNVGTLISFRLGVDDVGTVARQLREFEEDEILSLSMGEALVHIDQPNMTFNIRTCPPPPPESEDFTQQIIEIARRKYATPREVVEKRLQSQTCSQSHSQPQPHHQPPSPPKPKPKGPKKPPKVSQKPSGDPQDGDFIN